MVELAAPQVMLRVPLLVAAHAGAPAEGRRQRRERRPAARAGRKPLRAKTGAGGGRLVAGGEVGVIIAGRVV